ncbi:hypothetical protein RDABS01_036837 [Bienertia sinuspersici]
MAALFPPEIEEEILLRLPAKSLQRFSCVCKSWHSIIISSSFISSYNQRSSLYPQLLFLKHPYPHPLLPTKIHFSLSSESFVEYSTIKVPQASYDDDDDNIRPTRVELVTSNSINGVICVLVYMGLSNGYSLNCDMFLWNPSTSESFKIPNSEITGLFSVPPMVTFYSGFGFSCEDYKVVRVVYLDAVNPTTEVFSLRRNSWKDVSSISRSRISSNILWASSACTFVDGVGYWGAFKSETKLDFFLLGFDFEKESFRKIRIPQECIDGREMKYHSLWVYHEMLAISVLRFGEFDSKLARHYIWAMKDGEGLNSQLWYNLCYIDLEGGPRKPILTLGNGELLLLGEDDGEHALYDPVMEEVKIVDIFDVDTVVSYSESLVSFSQASIKIETGLATWSLFDGGIVLLAVSGKAFHLLEMRNQLK